MKAALAFAVGVLATLTGLTWALYELLDSIDTHPAHSP